MATKNKDAHYFPHDSNARNEEKLVRLRMKHSAAGYGVYFMILERLREEKDYTSVRDYNVIAYDLRVDAAIVKSVVEGFGLFAFTEDGKRFYSESLNRRMILKDLMNKQRSIAGKIGSEKRWSDSQTPAPQTPAPPQKLNSDNDNFLKRFFSDSNSRNIETLLMNFGLTPKDIPSLRKAAEDTISEWELSNQQHEDYTEWARHLIATMRIKAQNKKIAGVPPSDYGWTDSFNSTDK